MAQVWDEVHNNPVRESLELEVDCAFVALCLWCRSLLGLEFVHAKRNCEHRSGLALKADVQLVPGLLQRPSRVTLFPPTSVPRGLLHFKPPPKA